jgi:hypothetical protein
MAPKSNVKSTGAGKRTLSLSKNDEAASAAASSGGPEGAVAAGGGGGTKDVHPLRLRSVLYPFHSSAGAPQVGDPKGI